MIVNPLSRPTAASIFTAACRTAGGSNGRTLQSMRKSRGHRDFCELALEKLPLGKAAYIVRLGFEEEFASRALAYAAGERGSGR